MQRFELLELIAAALSCWWLLCWRYGCCQSRRINKLGGLMAKLLCMGWFLATDCH
jgi:hypothetical protein